MDIQAQLPPGRALDLGAGCGGNALLLASFGWSVVAVDHRPDAIQCMQSRLQGLPGEDKVEPVLLDLASDGIPDGPYSLVIALNVLHFLQGDEARRVLQDVSVSMAAGGLFWIRNFSHFDGPPVMGGYTPDPARWKQELEPFNVRELDTRVVRDNHPPDGEHTHTIVELLAEKDLTTRPSAQAHAVCCRRHQPTDKEVRDDNASKGTRLRP